MQILRVHRKSESCNLHLSVNILIIIGLYLLDSVISYHTVERKVMTYGNIDVKREHITTLIDMRHILE